MSKQLEGEALLKKFESHSAFIKRYLDNDPQKIHNLVESLIDPQLNDILPENTRNAAFALAVKLDSDK